MLVDSLNRLLAAKLATAHLFEFGLRLWATNAVDGKAVVALKLFEGGFERVWVGTVEWAGEITEIVEAGDLAGDFVDGIEMTDFDGDDVVGEGSLIAADGEGAFLGIEGDFLF